MENKELHMTLS